ncbi:MAG: hemerythrin domain-containing protein [Deltaproteobacteria bacterium]|nr:hemerythrin domain-containing protein [Deltaproteobacteria bacterium]
MKATDELGNEHEGIELMLRILQAVSAKVEQGEQVQAKHFDGILEFLSIFVDRCHHGKEEKFLFPLFESAGAAQERDLIGVLMKEHKEGRELVARLEDAVLIWGRARCC